MEEAAARHHDRRAKATIRPTIDARIVERFNRRIAGADVERPAAEFGVSVRAVCKAQKRIGDHVEERAAEQIREEDHIDGAIPGGLAPE